MFISGEVAGWCTQSVYMWLFEVHVPWVQYKENGENKENGEGWESRGGGGEPARSADKTELQRRNLLRPLLTDRMVFA